MLFRSLITGHEFLDDDCQIVKVTYDNGEIFYINYLIKDYITDDEIVIPARDFVKVGK